MPQQTLHKTFCPPSWRTSSAQLPTNTAPSVAQKRRRIRKQLSGAETGVTSQAVAYRCNHPWRGCLHSTGICSAQSMDQRLQRVLLHGTVNLDIVNCAFVLLQQTVARLDIEDRDTWSEELQTPEEIASKRDDICAKELHVPRAIGKHALTTVSGGGAIPFLKRITRIC